MFCHPNLGFIHDLWRLPEDLLDLRETDDKKILLKPDKVATFSLSYFFVDRLNSNNIYKEVLEVFQVKIAF